MPTLPAVMVTLLLPFERLFDPRTWRKASLCPYPARAEATNWVQLVDSSIMAVAGPCRGD